MRRPAALNLALAVALVAAALAARPASAVDTVTTQDAPDLAAVRASIKSKDFEGAHTLLGRMIDSGVQHADVYSLMGFTTRNLGDVAMAMTFYKKALDFEPQHKGAHEYLGELYLKLGDLEKAREQLRVLTRICPAGCEEREDLERAIVEFSAPQPRK